MQERDVLFSKTFGKSLFHCQNDRYGHSRKVSLIHVTKLVFYRLRLQALQKMNSGDTPLNTTALLIEKQKTAQSPYVILSGAGQTFSTGWVTSLIVLL